MHASCLHVKIITILFWFNWPLRLLGLQTGFFCWGEKFFEAVYNAKKWLIRVVYNIPLDQGDWSSQLIQWDGRDTSAIPPPPCMNPWITHFWKWSAFQHSELVRHGLTLALLRVTKSTYTSCCRNSAAEEVTWCVYYLIFTWRLLEIDNRHCWITWI